MTKGATVTDLDISDSATRRMGTIILDAMDYRLSRLHVCLPGVVQTYAAATQTATVLPSVKSRISLPDYTFFEDAYPVLTEVPVAFPRSAGSGAYLHMPLAAGDDVVLVFSEQSFDHWRTSGAQQDSPLTERRHDLADAIAMPVSARGGIQNVGDGALAFGYDGGSSIRILPNGDVLLGSQAGEPTGASIAVAEKVATQLQALVAVLTALQGDMTALGVALKIGTTTAAAITTLLTADWPLSTSSSKVKVLP